MRFKMMPSSSSGKNLDLSRLTDDEAKHVWQVIQRDFHLRKKEEDRLGELKTKIMKEDNKRELLEYQPKLSDSLCIRCLQPFKFLVNSKRQCLDCKLFVCKSCSRFNKKDSGWVCDPCHMARMLKIGTLEWFHENVRSRFKRFGSAKVMNSLFKRVNSDRACSQTDLREPRDDDTHSMPEVHTASVYSQEDEQSERTDRRHLSLHSGSQEKITQTKDSLAEDDWSTTVKQILENGTHGRGNEIKDIMHISQKSLDKASHFDDCTPHLNQRLAKSCSLSKMSLSSAGSTNYHLQRELSYSLDDSDDDEDDDEEESEMNVIYSHALHREPSPDEVPPQIIELNKRMSAIESILSRLEQKMTLPIIGGSVEQVEQKAEDLSPADLEELELRKKLDELTEKISDKGFSSDEEDAIKSPMASPKKSAVYQVSPIRGASAGLVRPDWPLEAEWKAKPNAHKSLKKQKRVSSFEFSNTTSCELSQLEGKVAMAAASVQSTQSGVTDIQKRIAALSAAGMTVETSRRREAAMKQDHYGSWSLCETMTEQFQNNDRFT
ncbi:melanophilin isoform X3 [Danio rerio]|uniref:Melanophilin b n=2 Tax=Danio rerio TaxID=7955 RepID=A0A8M9Q520_DANRE|nr:melanophilin isoform X3 [Danio rerio]XP_021334598.1 melanophilin isoform X3 [Danio rerio]|eukprot:XP_003199250.2 melanophilin isoform X3 [Danio rerio]